MKMDRGVQVDRLLESQFARPGQIESQAQLPVRKGCTCTGEITIDGIKYTGVINASCSIHGVKSTIGKRKQVDQALYPASDRLR